MSDAAPDPDCPPLPQARLLASVLPIIRSRGRRYRKFLQVRARPARPGEEVVTVTADGEETRNRAGEDHLLVQNLTAAGERYLMRRQSFAARYRRVEDAGAGWALYDAFGEILALEIDPGLQALLGVGASFHIVAPWGRPQVARAGDMLAAPWPALDEIYRIARREFEETYRATAAPGE
ncbi:hypothetical protein [Parahaliea aestuarii]|uniref:Uncharacterized protein n=1 Tax=Parahaliea aestuarii TaxID=1852021 RepID=A0A5C8ZSI8_9GAMM|nr:hypothetical protein [Parahaliea aestuarii]TXS90427.1 hypothetical protein FVW59_13875 [Parahaliea aestuarii]